MSISNSCLYYLSSPLINISNQMYGPVNYEEERNPGPLFFGVAEFQYDGMSAQLQGNVNSLLITVGVDLNSGQQGHLNSGDELTRTDGNLYFTYTGLQGTTGLDGVTGIRGSQGETGISGITGIAGITGLDLPGITGIAPLNTGVTGADGIVGNTGFSPGGVFGIQGSTGLPITGLSGNTGPVGLTGVDLQGIFGLLGATGSDPQGNTGLQGIGGVSPAGVSVIGHTGIDVGETGLMGITGIAPSGIAEPRTLFIENQESGLSLQFNLLANTLNSGYVEWMAWGTTDITGASSTITATFGGTTLITSNLGAPYGTTYFMFGQIIRISSTEERIVTKIVSSEGTISSAVALAAENLAANNNILISATNGNINCLVVRIFS